MLLKARGLLRGNDEKAALEQLAILREHFAKSPAAAISYIEEGRALTAKKLPANALACYEKLIERYGDDSEFEEFTSIAYFEAAQQAATLGRQRDAIHFLDVLVAKSPASPLRFYARLRQADLFRVLNDFDSALAVYENLIAAVPDHPDLRRVEIARADCLLALALAVGEENSPENRSARAANLAKAVAAYERLFSLPGAPCELMAEAGFKWAYAVSQSPKLRENASETTKKDAAEKAQKIYFATVNTVFEKACAGGNAPSQTWGATSGYWISRSLFALAELYEKSGDYVNARKAYAQIIDWSSRNWIPGAQYAQARLNAISAR